jgi:branched-chain amino acid transport system substrate-binding protein
MTRERCSRSSAKRAFAKRAGVAATALALLVGASSAPRAADEIVIGGTLCLTGIQAPLDEPGLRGAELAVKTINAAGGVLGRKLKYVNLDGKSDPVTVGNNAAQLIAQGVQLMVAPCDFDMGGPANREAQKAGIVGLSTCASSPLAGSLTLGDRQFTLSMWNTTMGAAGAEFAFNQKGWKKAYVVTDTFIDYTTSLSEYFISHYKSLGGTVIAEDKYTQGAQDFSAQLARLQRAEKPDVIFISSYMPDLGTIIRTIRQAGIAAPILGGDSYDDQGLFDALGAKYGSDVYFVTHSFMASGTTPKMDEFLKLYLKEYGKAPDTAMVATGWDTIQVFAQAIQKAGSTDGAAVAKAMENTPFDLLTGKLTWSDAKHGHEPDIEAAMVGLKGGKPEFLGWLHPANVEKPDYLVKALGAN